MFIFSWFCASVTSALKAFTPQHSNKKTQVQIVQSLEHVATHTGAYGSAYGTLGRGSNVKNPGKGENKLLNAVYILPLWLLQVSVPLRVL